MKDRILAFLQGENKSYAQFAEEIGVQPSGISHILSGRNNPSLDFVMKMLMRYPSLSAEWLLFGRGQMYRYITQPTLFDEEPSPVPSQVVFREDAILSSTGGEIPTEITKEPLNEKIDQSVPSVSPGRTVTRVIMFYSDKTFTEYLPS